MSSHHSAKFFDTHHSQVSAGRARKLKKAEERRTAFETQREVIQNEVLTMQTIQAIMIVTFFASAAGIVVAGLGLVF